MSDGQRSALIVERACQPDPARCIAAIVKLLTYRPATDTATQHDDQVSELAGADLVVEEDDREPVTTDTAF